MSLRSVSASHSASISEVTTLEENTPIFNEFQLTIPPSANYTQPYWLQKEGTVGMYAVEDKNIGMPDVIRDVKVVFAVEIQGLTLAYERNVIYKYNDDARGEVYEPFDVVPDVTMAVADKVSIFPNNKSKTISVTLRSARENVKGILSLELPAGWKVSPSSIPFSIGRKGSQQSVLFTISPPENADEATAKIVAIVDGKKFDKEQINIDYHHISKQLVLKPSEMKLIKLDIKTGSERIAYIMGAGDEVPKSLIQMGYEVTILNPVDINSEKLAGFDVVITGIRAYNVVKELAYKQEILFNFVAAGNTMIVQYNTLDDFVAKDIAPFPLKISRDRVTEEDAEVRFLAPAHPLLNHPNKITSDDFVGWKQEQGLYYPSEWDKAFTPVISSNDKGETPKNGAVLVARHGKGSYIYTGLSFFRELPEGVPGAFRLIANMISYQ
jgi:hypothetical protein